MLRVYASFGALNIGKKFGAMDIGRYCPFRFCTFDTMQMQKIYNVISLKQFVSAVLLPMVLSNGKVENAVTGGWSFGALFAFHAAAALEACSAGPRAVFALDPRFLLPYAMTMPASNPRRDAASQTNRETEHRSRNRASVNIVFEAVPQSRFSTPTSEFVCPLGLNRDFMNDDAINARRILYNNLAGEVLPLATTTHGTIGVDCAWDIARRLRAFIP